MNLEIYIWDQLVGVLSKGEHGIAFQYHPDFVNSALELSPLNLPLNNQVYINEEIWKQTNSIPGFINDSLPDKFGTDLLESYFLNKGGSPHNIDAFAKLQFIGTRGMGALEFRPSSYPENNDQVFSLTEIEKLSELYTKGKESFQTSIHENQATLRILQLGTSAQGARVKAVIAVHKDTQEIRSGQLKHPPEFEHYLLKIDGTNEQSLGEPSGYGRLEYTYYQMAIDCGISMSESKLLDNAHFMTKRFDRDSEGEKLHMHSLCGMIGADYNAIGQYSYNNYMGAARQAGLGQDSLQEIYKRMVFNVLTKNCDDHTKNFAFLMNKKGEWQLAPAFDLCYSYDNSNEWVAGHNMRVNGKRKDITYQDLLAAGEDFNIKKRDNIILEVKTIVDKFKDYATKNNVSDILINEVEKNRPLISL